MRKPDATFITAIKPFLAAGRGDAPVELVCGALVLALLALVMRIVTIW